MGRYWMSRRPNHFLFKDACCSSCSGIAHRKLNGQCLIRRHTVRVRVARPFYYMKQRQVYYELDWNNDTGYLPDGRALNKVGNQNNHPELQGPDLHPPGAPLPKAKFGNEVGYLPDGTPMNKCGNMNNHPEISAPDPHTPGAPLPPPLFGYINDVGYLPNGQDMNTAGNRSCQK